MTKEEQDRREAEKRARMEGAPDLGGVALPFSRAALLKVFWSVALLFPVWTLWNAKQDLTLENVLAGSVLYVVCMLPGWFWVTGRTQGLPIFPVFALNFLPSYVTPLWQGHDLLKEYTAAQINNAAWTTAGFLAVAQLFWQQTAVRAMGVPHAVRMINMKKAEQVLLWCLVAEAAFELASLFFQQFGGGIFAVLRGFAGAAGRMGLFVFSYQLGQGKLSPGKKIFFLSLVALLVIQECASLLLSTVLPTLGIAFAGYILGSGKLPWKAVVTTVVAITVLHAGKFEMRAIYHEGGKKSEFTDLPAYFMEWVGYGIKNLTTPASKLEMEDSQKTSEAKQRASLIHLMVMIQSKTPDQVPYLDGATYWFIPSLLIPRILSPEKAWAHTGNMILALQYGILDQVGIFKTSVGFDPVMEAYANYGYLGVFVLAVVLGFFLGWSTRLTIHVPMLSFGFLFGVQVIACVISGWNTMGVFVTTVWQSFLALVGLSFVLMSKQNNPVWKYYALKLAEKLKFKSDAKLKKTLEEVRSVLSKEDNNKDIGYGISDIGDNTAAGGRRDGAVGGQGSVVSGRPAFISENPSPVPQRHERPTRFVYGEKKPKS